MRVPTQRELSGDFSQSGITVYDPLTTRPDPPTRVSSSAPVPRQRDPGQPHQPGGGRATAATGLRRDPPTPQLVDRSDHGHAQARSAVDAELPDLGACTRYYAFHRAAAALLPKGRRDPGDRRQPCRPRRRGRSTAPCTSLRSTTRSRPTRPPSRTCASATPASPTTACHVAGFDPGTLGFSPSFVNQSREEVPVLRHRLLRHGLQRLHVRRAARSTASRTTPGTPTPRCRSSSGRHTVKFGASLPPDRRARTSTPASPRGQLLLRRPVHERRPAERRQRRSRTRSRRFLLGYPVDAVHHGGQARPTRTSTTTRDTRRTTSASTRT